MGMVQIIKNIIESLLTVTFALTPKTVPYIQQAPDLSMSYKTGFHQTITSDIENTYIKKESSTEQVKASQSNNWWNYPTDIKIAKRNGDDLLVLVNKEYKLPSSYVPSDLVPASESGIRLGEKFMLRNILVNDLKELLSAAQSDGVDLSIVSGYRSYQEQVATYKYWVNYNGGSTDYADMISARAGHSQHQLGTAIDFSSAEINDGLSGIFTNTQASKWLSENAWKYGFVISFPKGVEDITGYSYESWHYRYIGKENAKEMIESGLILEKYLQSKN